MHRYRRQSYVTANKQCKAAGNAWTHRANGQTGLTFNASFKRTLLLSIMLLEPTRVFDPSMAILAVVKLVNQITEK